MSYGTSFSDCKYISQIRGSKIFNENFSIWNHFKNIDKKNEGVSNEHPRLSITDYLPFGLAFEEPVDFLPVLGAAFFALAFVAILVRCI